MTTRRDPRTITFRNLRANLADTVGRVRYGGERVVLTTHGRPALALVPVADLELLQQLGSGAEAEAEADAVVEESVLVSTPLPMVWRALTEERLRTLWWPVVELDPWVGSRFGERVLEQDGRVLVVTGWVTELDDRSLLRFSWEADGLATTVALHLHEESAGTRVGVTHTGWGDAHDAAARARTMWAQHLVDLRDYLHRAGGHVVPGG